MLTTIIKRLLQGLLVIVIVMVVTFVLLRLIPGDPARTMAGSAGQEVIDSIREEMGLNDPIPIQFVNYIKIFSGEISDTLISTDLMWQA